MNKLFFTLLLFLFAFISCEQQLVVYDENNSNAFSSDTLIQSEKINPPIGQALLLTQYKSLNELKSVIKIKYLKDSSGVCLSCICRGCEVTHELKSGLGQDDFSKAAKGNFWDKLRLGIRCPFAVWNKKALTSIENLGRRKDNIFGHPDVAFYDLAESMVLHISDEDRENMSEKDLGEKGYLNTFEHVTTSAMMASIFSESIADFVGDAHERSTMPELITGKFTTQEITDIDFGPVDNYLDLINNEWGQRFGKVLKEKYHINQNTLWTPKLLADFLNDLESYYSWVFKIAFNPVTPDEEIIIQFALKMNKVL
ncbi:MAG: hypothetical protein D4R43_00140 [Sphingobacteriales bacterium]|nr:MAG: hypothetical protein D4R43_00140 [Sphingobacteriales bacterium]